MFGKVNSPKDKKLSKTAQCKLYKELLEEEQQFFGSVEHFLECCDVYSNWAAPWCLYYVDR